MPVTMRDIVTFDVTEEIITQAQEIRNDRDNRYGNIFSEAETDMRWVGEIGELMVNEALCLCREASTEWLTEDVTEHGDFHFCGLELEVKTVKRKVPMRPHYKAQITARHANKPADYLIFTCYEFPVKKLHILGVMTKEEFMAKATYYGPGDKVHEHYTIREGHEIYAVTVSEMTPVRDFLRQAMRTESQRRAA